MLSNDFAKEPRKASMNSNCAGSVKAGELLDRNLEEQQLLFPVGILGFPESRHYRLERYRPEDGSESPFLTLKCLDQELSFALIHPRSLGLDYRVSVDDEMLNLLSAASAEQLSALLIVTLRARIEDITVNLQGPLIINPASSLGLQLVIEHYPVRYPLIHIGGQII
jgi:flagellar assembly factor FliW